MYYCLLASIKILYLIFEQIKIVNVTKLVCNIHPIIYSLVILTRHRTISMDMVVNTAEYANVTK